MTEVTPGPARSCGPGSSNGCLSAVPLDTDGSAAARRSNPERRAADKHTNIYTCGPKTGGERGTH